jgi:hypothetical protein
MTIFDDMAEKRAAASPSCQKVESGCCGVPVYQLSPIQFTYNGSMSEANADYLAACINDISTAQWRAMKVFWEAAQELFGRELHHADAPGVHPLLKDASSKRAAALRQALAAWEKEGE